MQQWNQGIEDGPNREHMSGDGRGSLGMFIERSTSAPPRSSSATSDAVGSVSWCFKLLMFILASPLIWRTLLILLVIAFAEFVSPRRWIHSTR